MDFNIKISFMDKPSKTVKVSDEQFNSDAILKALRTLNSLESRDVIGINITYIGKYIHARNN